MKVSVLAAVIVAAVFGGLDWWLWVHHHTSSAVLIALGAFGVSCFAQFQASRSAHNAAKSAALAQLNEERLKYGWDITVHPEGDRYVLRNMGTLTAHDVRFINVDPNSRIEFEQHEGEQGPTIPRGQAVAFRARFTYQSAGNAIEFDWIPAGEKTRQTHKDVLDDIPRKNPFAEMAARNRENSNETLKDSAAAHRQWCVEIRRHLIDLARAWADYQTDETVQNKMRVQGLVSALPSNMVRAMGFAVDVPRDFWGVHQWPLENFVQDPKDKQLVRDNAPMIELMWNLTWVQIPSVAESDLSQHPDPWHRIEHAVNGYVELVRNREQGKVEFRDGPRDRKHREEAITTMKQNEAMLNRAKPAQQT
jgi:hypothetical protein